MTEFWYTDALIMLKQSSHLHTRELFLTDKTWLLSRLWLLPTQIGLRRLSNRQLSSKTNPCKIRQARIWILLLTNAKVAWLVELTSLRHTSRESFKPWNSNSGVKNNDQAKRIYLRSQSILIGIAIWMYKLNNNKQIYITTLSIDFEDCFQLNLTLFHLHFCSDGNFLC